MNPKNQIILEGLDGSNPQAFMAALGTLKAIDRMQSKAGKGAKNGLKMSWTIGSQPHPILYGAADIDNIVQSIISDRDEWKKSPALNPKKRCDTLKFTNSEGIREYLEESINANDGYRSLEIVNSLLAEGSLDRKNKAKPTDLYFLSGQQKFLPIIRKIRDILSEIDVHNALVGPWGYDNTEIGSLMWDMTNVREYAKMASNPTVAKSKPTNPGVEWLAFLSLSFFPVFYWRSEQEKPTATTGCKGRWSEGRLIWPIWTEPANIQEIKMLLTHTTYFAGSAKGGKPYGIASILESAISREGGQGYGGFLPPSLYESN